MRDTVILLTGLWMGALAGYSFHVYTQPPAEVKYIYRCSYAWMDAAIVDMERRNEEAILSLMEWNNRH